MITSPFSVCCTKLSACPDRIQHIAQCIHLGTANHHSLRAIWAGDTPRRRRTGAERLGAQHPCSAILGGGARNAADRLLGCRMLGGVQGAHQCCGREVCEGSHVCTRENVPHSFLATAAACHLGWKVPQEPGNAPAGQVISDRTLIC
eukprot:1195184-Prorocentrum_minimum.AAC.5